MKKWILAAGLLLFLLLATVYLGSPYYAARSLRDAAQAGDGDRLAALVDFPAVRASIAPQVTESIEAAIGRDPRRQDSEYVAIGMMLLPGVVRDTLEAFVTPDGIAAMLRWQRPNARRRPETAADAGAEADIESRARYESLDRFRIRLRNARSQAEGPSFLLARRGFASWKLVGVDLPPAWLDDDGAR